MSRTQKRVRDRDNVEVWGDRLKVTMAAGLGLVAIGGAGAAAGASRAQLPAQTPSYPWNQLCTPSGSKSWTWVPQGTGANTSPASWTTADQNAAVNGFNRWEASLRPTGSPLVDMGAGSATPVLRGTENVPGHPAPNGHDHNSDGWDDHVSQANCSKIQISSPIGASYLNRSSAHEMGHSIGLNHTGRRDVRQNGTTFGGGYFESASGGGIPLINGNCLTATSPNPTPDEWGSASRHLLGHVTAESGFEGNAISQQLWRGQPAFQTSLPFQGAQYVRIPNTTALTQRMRVYAAAPNGFRAVSAFKTAGTGAANFKVFGKRLSYPSWECGTPTYTDANWVQIQNISNFDPDGAGDWEVHVPSTNTFPGGNFATYELELQVYNSTGSDLYVDNFRLEMS